MPRLWAVALGFGLLGATGCDKSGAEPTAVPGEQATIVLSIQNVECEGCVMPALEKLKAQQGVTQAELRLGDAELHVTYDAAVVDTAALMAVVKEAGYDSVEGAGQGTFTPEVQFPDGMDVQKLDANADLDLAKSVVAGKSTIFDFYAQWCAPCREVDKHLTKQLEGRTDVAIRRIDIGDWESEVAKKFVAERHALPHLVVYGADGSKTGEVTGKDLAALDKILPATPATVIAPAAAAEAAAEAAKDPKATKADEGKKGKKGKKAKEPAKKGKKAKPAEKK